MVRADVIGEIVPFEELTEITIMKGPRMARGDLVHLEETESLGGR